MRQRLSTQNLTCFALKLGVKMTLIRLDIFLAHGQKAAFGVLPLKSVEVPQKMQMLPNYLGTFDEVFRYSFVFFFFLGRIRASAFNLSHQEHESSSPN